MKQVGQTKDTGFQFGIRKSFSVSEEKMWDFLFSKKGLDIWLGKLLNKLELNKPFKTKDGIEGLVRVFKINSHIRINWQSKDWENTSLVQIRVIENNNKTTVSFHQEKLLNDSQRGEMKLYWNDVVARLTNEVNQHNFI